MLAETTDVPRRGGRHPADAAEGVDLDVDAASGVIGRIGLDPVRESYADAFLEVGRARRCHRTRVALVALLSGCVPPAYEVVGLHSWAPAAAGRATPGRVLRSDVVVRGSSPRDCPDRPPVLCVDIADLSPSSSGPARGRACARAGVDHYWYLDPEAASLETYVRTDDDFRHAETFHAGDGATWIDFGVGVAVVALAGLLDPPQRTRSITPQR